MAENEVQVGPQCEECDHPLIYHNGFGCFRLIDRLGDLRCPCLETQPRPAGTPSKTVYHLFIEEVDALSIAATEPAVAVVGRLTRAVKRAQLVHEGELASVAQRTLGEGGTGDWPGSS